MANLSSLPCLPSIHLCITQLHTKSGVAEQFLKDVKDSIEDIMNNLNAKTTGMVRIQNLIGVFVQGERVSWMTLMIPYNDLFSA